MAKKSGWSRPMNTVKLGKYKQKAQISVGIHEDAPDYQDGTDLSMVANLLEFGTETMKEYRWLEKAVTADTAVYTAMFTKALRKSKTDKRQFNLMMDEIGRRAVDAVQQHVEQNDIGLPANMPSTQIMKRGDSPLINTRHLVRNIDYKREK